MNRYVGRKKDYEGVLPDPMIFGVWDSFAQGWVEDELYASISIAISAAGRLNIRDYQSAVGKT